MKRNFKYFNRKNPLLFAHRGYSSRAPENTLPAFALAREEGIPGVELDVHLCATGEVVVIHDDKVDRTTDGTGEVSELTLDEIKKLDAGSWKGAEFSGTRVPLLSEVFDLLGPDVIYDIEIKSRSREKTALEGALLHEIEEAGLEEHCIITSFNPFSIKHFKNLAPHLPVGIIYSSGDEIPSLLRKGEGRFFTQCSFLKPHHVKVNRFYMAYFSSLLGYPILPWTVDDPEQARVLIKKGAAGIISNDPGPLKSLFKSS